MKLLFLSRWFPYPPNNGSKVRILNLLKILAAKHQITLLSFDDELEKLAETTELEIICEKIITIPWKPYRSNSIKALFGFFATTPRSIIDTFSADMAKEIQKICSNDIYNLVIASQIEMASYQKYFEGQTAIFDEIEIGVPLERYTKTKSATNRLRQGITWLKLKRYLTRLLKSFPVCTVASQEEYNLLVENGIRDKDIFVVPNCIDLVDYQEFRYPTKKDKSIIFTGSFRYQPNYEAMMWFLEKVFPLILQSDPEIELIITGDHMDFPLPASSNVNKTGFIDDIRPLIAKAMVSVVPLQSGGGTRLKILEAMALCTPVVSTTKGAEGIDAVHQKDLFVADNPSDFANAVVRLSHNGDLRKQIASQGLALVEEKYSLKAITNRYQNILDQVSRGQ